MKRRRLRRVLCALSVVGAVGLWSSPLQSLAAEVAPLQLCLAVAADGSAVYPTAAFPAGGTDEIVAVFFLPQGRHRSLAYEWTVLDVGGKAAPGTLVAKGRLGLGPRSAEHGTLRLTGTKKPMPLGKYRLDVSLDGTPWHSADFSIVAPIAAAPVRRPTELLSLAEGAVWTYAFVQRAGMGGKVNLPGISPDAEGNFRATVTMTAAAAEDAGFRIDTRRNGELVVQEWWRIDEHGWSATRRKVGGDSVVLDPPQLFLRLPLAAPRAWGYEPRDGAFKQRTRMWGPLPVKGPRGETSGWVVVVEQPPAQATMTVERHIVPGLGLVREITIIALGGELISRQELTLTGVQGAR